MEKALNEKAFLELEIYLTNTKIDSIKYFNFYFVCGFFSFNIFSSNIYINNIVSLKKDSKLEMW